jgi:hypothetical protein
LRSDFVYSGIDYRFGFHLAEQDGYFENASQRCLEGRGVPAGLSPIEDRGHESNNDTNWFKRLSCSCRT